MESDLEIWQVAKICLKLRIYLGIGLSVWETAKIFGKWLNYLTKYLKNVENDLEIWEMAKIFGKWFRCMRHSLSIWKTA